MTRTDPNFIYRVVGFHEYVNAIQHFDWLLAHCTTEELAAVDSIISDRPEFTIYTNLSRRVPIEGSILAERGVDVRDDFRRIGLPWVMSLARVEVGAMLAQFSNLDEPFHVYPPSPLESQAFLELITDGTRMHYASLLRDNAFSRLDRRRPDEVTLAYARRLLLAVHFAKAMSQLTRDRLNVAEASEFAHWTTNLVDWNEGLTQLIQGYIASIQASSSVSSQTTNQTGGFLMRCSDLCDQITRELDAELMQNKQN